MNYMLLESLAVFNVLIKNSILKISGLPLPPCPPAIYSLAPLQNQAEEDLISCLQTTFKNFHAYAIIPLFTYCVYEPNNQIVLLCKSEPCDDFGYISKAPSSRDTARESQQFKQKELFYFITFLKLQ